MKDEVTGLLPRLRLLASQARAGTRALFRRLGKTRPRSLDAEMAALHEAVFAHTDCTQCANCCKTTSPLFEQADIDRLAAHLQLRPGQFVQQYLRVDEDGDYVLQQTPCPFLGGDNLCGVYDQRPRACREYPHTNRKRFVELLDLTLRNTEICPAAYVIVERLKAQHAGG